MHVPYYFTHAQYSPKRVVLTGFQYSIIPEVPWVPILSITRITPGLCYQRLVHEITFTTRFTIRSKK